MHDEVGLTHTDLKPENILLKMDTKKPVIDQEKWPIQVRLKKQIYENDDIVSDSSEEEKFSQITPPNYDNTEDGCTGGDVGKGFSNVESSAEQLRQRRHRFKEKVWLRPLDDQIKIIDFGGATYADENHTSVINTRQYRAPEVILECCDWNEKSDIWSLVCIFIELYTGELFYETREDVEHLAMIEKQCGPIPEWMSRNSQTFSSIFNRDFSAKSVDGVQMRIDWPAKQKKESSYETWQSMKLLSHLVQHQHNEFHKEFLDLLASMMKIDPKDRPSARQCLEHTFFK